MDRLYTEAEKAGNQVAEFVPVGRVGQNGEKLFLQHFTRNPAAAVGVGGTAIGVVPGARSAVGQFRLGFCTYLS